MGLPSDAALDITWCKWAIIVPPGNDQSRWWYLSKEGDGSEPNTRLVISILTWVIGGIFEYVSTFVGFTGAATGDVNTALNWVIIWLHAYPLVSNDECMN